MLTKSMISLIAFATSALAQDQIYTYTPTTFSTLDLYNVTNVAPFQIYNDAFKAVLGSSPTLTNILNSSNSSFPQFHEAGIFYSETVLFVTSNQYTISNSPSTNNKAISITRLDLKNGVWVPTIITPQGTITLANGGTKYKDGLVFCDQGSLTAPGGLVYMNASAPYETKLLINNYYGSEFNSPNDVFATSDGALWFTDPSYGSWQGIRPAPQLPNQIYRYVPETNDLRVVADGIIEPNGITFSPDEKTVYITDGAGNSTARTSPRTIYAYDVVTIAGQLSLANKRTFAMVQTGIPDGIKTDKAGNVYAGCGDGVNVWNKGGLFLGKIFVSGGAANFILGTGEDGEREQVWLLSEERLWLAKLAAVNETAAGNGSRRV
ncbi:hypothetical protein ACMFMG_007513 [Clarireedia jacksonii]